MNIRLDGKFTLNCVEEGPNYRVTVSEISYKRGDYSFSPRFAPLCFDSYGYMEYHTGSNVFHLPGTFPEKHKSVLVDKEKIDQLIRALDYFDDKGEIKPEYRAEIVATLEPRKYYLIGEEIQITDCKELILDNFECLSEEDWGKSWLLINEQILKPGRDRLRALQKNIPEEHRFVVKPFKGATYVKFSKWWKEQLLYKIGWALLRIREESRKDDELINGETVELTPKIEKHLQEFENGAFSLRQSAYNKWSYEDNWLKFNENYNSAAFTKP